jgi:hypothetical protein
LLLGGALLVYAAVLVGETGPSGHHGIPLWGLIGGVGGVIAGAGVFSTFLDAPLPLPPSGLPGDDFVLVPRKEWERFHPSSTASPERYPRTLPAWYEGVGARRSQGSRPSTESSPSSSPKSPGSLPSLTPPGPTSGEAPSPTGPPANPAVAPVPPPGPVPPSAETAGQPATAPALSPEFRDVLAELENFADRALSAGRRRPPAREPEPSPECADCGRTVGADELGVRCEECRRSICSECLLDAFQDDGRWLCPKCRRKDSDGT